MTEAEWFESDDAPRMITALRELRKDQVADLERQLHRYYLACCRAIWKLLPQEASRNGVVVAEQRLAGGVSDDEFHRAEYHCEGAAFNIDYDCDPVAVRCWINQTRAIPEAELRAMLHPSDAAHQIETRELLKRAAYFADYAMVSQGITPQGYVFTDYDLFLSADLLREAFGNPFRAVHSDHA
jgi:hypothetical protein